VNKIRLAISIAMCTCLAHSNAGATCLIKNAQDYTADVRAVADPALDAASASGNEAAAAVIAAAIAGTEAGELIDFGIAKWWDPTVEVFPNDPSHIVSVITDAQINSISDSLLGHILPGLKLSDLNNLNILSPGLGDAAVNLLNTGVRAFANIAQGAAAYAVSGRSSPNVLVAAVLANSDLSAYTTALTTFSAYLVPFDNLFMPFTVNQYQAFLEDVKTQGSAALPPSEIEVGQDILNLANVHMTVPLEQSLADEAALGDVYNQAAACPSTGYSQSGLLFAGGGRFDVNCLTCTIAAPEPSTWAMMLFGLAGLGLVGYQRRRVAALPGA
jgi:PEP-CTERM motif